MKQSSKEQTNEDLTKNNGNLNGCRSLSPNNLKVKTTCDSIVNDDKDVKSSIKRKSIVYRCKKCRTVLASDDNVLPHNTKMKYEREKGNEILLVGPGK